MADIELVIKIPEWQYKSICEGVEASKRCGVVGIDPNIHEAIYNGTPLSKGHGRLIDESNLMPDSDYEDGIFYAVSIGQINSVPTIIEADKAEFEPRESEEISERNMKMWQDIFEEEKRRSE